jgi:HK97 family phage major capsid protein
VQQIAGLNIYSTPALAAGTAIVAQASEILVALRRDPTIEVSDQALFSKDGTVARVIARLDAGVGDADGLCKITGP